MIGSIGAIFPEKKPKEPEEPREPHYCTKCGYATRPITLDIPYTGKVDVEKCDGCGQTEEANPGDLERATRRVRYMNENLQTQKARIYRWLDEHGPAFTEALKIGGLQMFPCISAADQVARFLEDEDVVWSKDVPGSKTLLWGIKR